MIDQAQLLTSTLDCFIIRSENYRRAKFYESTSTGSKRLQKETDGWNRLVAAVACALAAKPEEI